MPHPPKRIMMISTHGYVVGQPELGQPDTGGQVVYVLKLSECLARLGYRVDIITRRFEDQPAIEPIADRVRIVRHPERRRTLIRKEWMCDVIPEWVANAEAVHQRKGLSDTTSSTATTGTPASRATSWPAASASHTPHAALDRRRGSATTWTATRRELEREYNFARRIRDERAIYDSADCDHRDDAAAARHPGRRRVRRPDPAKIGVIPPGYRRHRVLPGVARDSRRRSSASSGVDGRRRPRPWPRSPTTRATTCSSDAMPTVIERVPDARLLLAVGSTEPTPGESAQVEDLQRLPRSSGIADRVIFHDYIPDDAPAGSLPCGRRLRPQQSLRTVRHDRRRGDGLRDAGRHHDRRRAVGDGRVGDGSAVRQPVDPRGLRARDRDDPALSRGSPDSSRASARTAPGRRSPGTASRSSSSPCPRSTACPAP